MLVEATNLVVDQFSWPSVVGQVVTVLAFFGFFVVLVIAWYHGERGRQWVSGPELLIIALLLLISGGVLSMLGGGDQGPSLDEIPVRTAEDEKPSIAVLPFQNFSPNPEDAYFADGMQEQLVSTLSKIRGLSVRGRTSVMRYREDPKPIPEIAGELGVAFIIEGSARIAGSRVAVTAQLIDARRDEHLWSDDFELPFSVDEVISIHREIAQHVTTALSAVLTPEEEARVGATPTQDLEAYNDYLLGRFWWNRRTAEALEVAIAYFEKAVGRDAEFALAYAGLAACYLVLPFYDASFPAEVAHTNAITAVQRAIELDDQLAEAHNALAFLKAVYESDWEAAEAGHRLAIQLSPAFADAHHWYGLILAYQRRFDEALDKFGSALEFDPLSRIINNNLGDVLYYSGRYDEAVEQYEKTLDLYPGTPQSVSGLTLTYLAKGMYEEAIELSPDTSFTVVALSALGRDEEASALATRFENAPIREQLRIKAGTGDIQGAFQVLEEFLRSNHPSLKEEPNVLPFYNSLHDHPQWAEYLRKIGLGG